jgi:hypothetical protein
MWRNNGRRRLYTEAYVASLMAKARSDLHALNFEQLTELKRLRNDGG